ncbi:MAG TPA: hypothetical protein VEB22_05970, partial [Phycisphaerales bacterium]|nr:hypothetical protein [Phycisphaerales bacterium]
MSRYWSGCAGPSAEVPAATTVAPSTPKRTAATQVDALAPTVAASAPPADSPTKAEAPAPAVSVAPALTPPTVAAVEAPRTQHARGVGAFFSGEAVASAPAADAAPRVRISNLALCSKVEAFGRFTRLDSARLTGRPVALLVYTQVEGFAYRTLGGEEVAPGVDEA